MSETILDNTFQRFFIEIAFDGTSYFGWQIQPNHISIQETISKILSKFYDKKIDITGCGRTDTGVHAKQYFFHFDVDIVRNNLFQRLRYLFPKDIQLLNVYETDNKAHARFDATERSYTYFLHQRKNIFKRHYSLGVDLHKLNASLISEACNIFVNNIDYKNLSKKNLNLDNSNSIVKTAHWEFSENLELASFNVSANRFLHNQIRRMVGVLLNIGLEKTSLEELKAAFEKDISLKYNDTVAPNGLFLHSIKYPFIKTNHQTKF